MQRSSHLLAGLVVTLAIAVAGCGGEGSSTAAKATPPAPEAAQPVTQLVSAIEGLGPHGDCEQAVKLINPADLPEPEGGASPANCEATQVLVDGLRTFEPSGSAEFGTAALIDGEADGKPVALQAALDGTKSFKLIGVTTRGPQIDTKASSDVDFEAPAVALVKALRDDDCTSARAAIAHISRLSLASLKQFCASFEDSFMTDDAGLGARLQADPTADLADLGGTRNTHFFALATKPAGYRTIVVGTVAHGEPRVLDVVPVER
jgi:hypothetical protein